MGKRIYEVWVTDDILLGYADSKGKMLCKFDGYFFNSSWKIDIVLKGLGYDILTYSIDKGIEENKLINEIIDTNKATLSDTLIAEIEAGVLDLEWTALNEESSRLP